MKVKKALKDDLRVKEIVTKNQDVIDALKSLNNMISIDKSNSKFGTYSENATEVKNDSNE